MFVYSLICFSVFFYLYGDHRDLHVLTHSFPTRRSSDPLLLRPVLALAATGGLLLVWSGVAVMAMMQFLVLPVAVPAIAALLTLGGMLGWRFAVSDRDQRFLRDRFSLYLAPALVDRLVAGQAPPAPGGEIRRPTVFFPAQDRF